MTDSNNGKRSAANQFRLAADRLYDRVYRWGAGRWATRPGPNDGPTNADIVYELLQQLADLGADLHQHERHDVPRLPVDTAIADQLAVISHDLADIDEERAQWASQALQRTALRLS